jgi:hypothetical protein
MNTGIDATSADRPPRRRDGEVTGLAYLILCHKQPEQVARLAGKLHHPDDIVVIHVDRKSDLGPFRRALDEAGLNHPNVVLLEDRQEVNWADFGSVAASLGALRAALAHDRPWSRAILLSGQCYPLKPRRDIVRTLAASGDRSFLQSDDTEDFSRLLCRHFTVFGRRFRVPNRFTAGLPPPRRLPLGLRPFKGAAWWVLTREAAAWIAAYSAEHPELEAFFRRSFIPDENYYQVVLQNSEYRDRIINDHLRYIVWENWHPMVLRASETPAMVASDRLFARKFDIAVDAAVLDELDRHLAEQAREPGPDQLLRG